jgi:hypothetical protein
VSCDDESRESVLGDASHVDAERNFERCERNQCSSATALPYVDACPTLPLNGFKFVPP